MRRDAKILGLVLVVASVLYVLRSSSSSRRLAESTADDIPPGEVEQSQTQQLVAPTPAPVATPRVAAPRADASGLRDSVMPDEEQIMAKLRLLGASSPLESVALARHGNEYFPAGSGAPERHLIIVRSLESLRRFHEARDQAEQMVAKYPEHPLALDVKRHVLVYPLDQPSREEQQRSAR